MTSMLVEHTDNIFHESTVSTITLAKRKVPLEKLNTQSKHSEGDNKNTAGQATQETYQTY
jgi:hypothetical protein